MPRRATQQVSLFPFLAVLVCTMGALILLLLVTTRQIRSGQEKRLAEAAELETPSETAITVPPAASQESAERQAQPPDEAAVESPEATTQPPDSPLPDLEELRRKIAASDERLKQIRDEQTQNAAFVTTAADELRDSQTTHAQLVAEQRLLEKEQRDLARQLAAAEIQHKNTLTTRDQIQVAVGETRSLVRRLQQQLDETAAQVAQSESFRKLKIELHSNDGMAEEPVLVECSAQSLRLVAENIPLTERELTGYPTADNPLIAAVRTIVNERRQQLNDAYVLLLVRPNGSLSFYAAQKLLRGTGIRFGYELIDDDQALQVEPAAEATVAACQQAIQQSIERRDVLYARLGAALDGNGNRVVLTESGTIVPEPPTGSQMPNVAKVERHRPQAFGGGSPGAGVRSPARNERPRIATSSALKDSHRMAGEAVGGFLRELGSARSRQRQDSDRERRMGGANAPSDGREVASQSGSMRIRPRDNTFQTFDSSLGETGTDLSDAASSGSQPLQAAAETPVPGSGERSNRTGRAMDPTSVASSNGSRPNSDDVTETPPLPGRNPQALTAESFPGFASPGDAPAGGNRATAGTESLDPSGWTASSAARASSNSSPAGSGAAGSAEAGISATDDQAGAADPGDRLAAMDQATIERFLRLARAKQKMLERREQGTTQPVTVFVDTNWLTVEEQDSLRIVNLDDETLHTEFIRGVVNEVTDDSGGTSLPALPLVRFVVSPGATVTHHRLQRLLDAVALPHASMISMQPYAIDAPQSQVAASSFGTAAGESPR